MYVSMIQPSLEIICSTQRAHRAAYLRTVAPVRAVQLAACATDAVPPARCRLRRRPDRLTIQTWSRWPVCPTMPSLWDTCTLSSGRAGQVLQQKDADASQRYRGLGHWFMAVALARWVIVAAQTIITRRLRLLAVKLRGLLATRRPVLARARPAKRRRDRPGGRCRA